MNEKPSTDALARSRFFTISLIRLFGAVLVVTGILTVNQKIDLPNLAGYILIVIGLGNTFVIPQMLVRRWRTPQE